MEYPIVIKLPKLFYIDHRNRDLPSGNLLRTIGNRVEVELDKEAFDDLQGDARHYGFGGMDWDGDSHERSLERSARRVYEILTKIEEEGND